MRIVAILFLFFYGGINAQESFSVHFAQTYSKFRFTDTNGNSDENMMSDIRYAYGINYSKLFNSGFFIRPETGYKNLGAVSILNNQKLSWSLHYADANIGAGYLINKFKFQPYAGASLYFAFLYKAEQSIGSAYYNLMQDKEIKTTDYGVNFYGGVKYEFTDLAGVCFELRKSTGLKQLEENSSDGANQKLFNRSFSFHFVLVFSINK